MRILYFDCFNGASGDMVLGALLDAGLPLEALRGALGSLAIDDFEVTADKVLRAGVSATKFRLVEKAAAGAPASHSHTHEHAHSHGAGQSHGHAHSHSHDHPHEHGQAHTAGHGHDGAHAHRTLSEIFAHIDRSALSAAGKAKARALFERLAEAEAAIHQMPIERVHLHEVGALDSIVDIVGAVFALEWFGADQIVVLAPQRGPRHGALRPRGVSGAGARNRASPG